LLEPREEIAQFFRFLTPMTSLRPFLLLFTLLLVPSVQAADESEPGLLFDGDPAGFEYPLIRALGEDTEVYERARGLPALDPTAAALQRGDLMHAYAEITATINAPEEAAAAPARARAAWFLARLGAVHYAADHANLAWPFPAVRGEARLARAWMLWQTGNFAEASREASLAAEGAHPAPAWALADWQRSTAALAKAAAAFAAAKEPDNLMEAAFLDHTDLARRAGALYAALSLYERAESMLQQEQSAAPGTPRDRYERALAGQRDTMLALWGGRLPGPAYAQVRTLILRLARVAAVDSRSPAAWESYFKLVAEVQAAPGAFDFAALDLPADVSAAEKLAGLGPDWRERFRPLLADPRLRYASRLNQALARCAEAPGFSGTVAVEDPAALAALLDLVAREERVLASLRAQVPAEAAEVPGGERFTQLAALTRLRQALAQGNLEEARAQFARVDASDAFYDFDRAEFIAAIDGLEQSAFHTAVAALQKGELAELAPEVLAAARRQADALMQRLSGNEAGETPDPAGLPAELRQDYARALYVRVIEAAKSGRVIAAERALQRLEQWCKRAGLDDAEELVDAQFTVLELPPDPEDFTAEERPIAAALAAGESRPEFIAVLEASIARDPDRLQPRLLLMRAWWLQCEDLRARHQVELIRPLVPTNLAVPSLLDDLFARNDVNTACDRWRAAIRAAAPDRQAAVARSAEPELGALLERYHRLLNGGRPISPEQDIGDHKYRYRYILGTVACTQAVQGGLRGALELLPHLPFHAEKATREFLAEVPFRHDLPGDAHQRAWRELLQDKPLSVPVRIALHQAFTPYYGRSLTADLALVVQRYRNQEFDQAKELLAGLRARYGANAAFAAQLGQLEQLINVHTRVTLLFSNNRAVDRELEQARAELSRYVDQHRETLQEVYSREEHSAETRTVDALEARISEIKARGRANEGDDQRRLDEAAQERAQAQTRAFRNLLNLTL
jgi:hypothetical protein